METKFRATHAIDASRLSLVDFHTGELIFGEIAADADGAARLRYVRSIFAPEASVRRPATLPPRVPGCVSGRGVEVSGCEWM